MIYKAHRYRIYPNKEQTEFFVRNIGASRFVYNYYLEKWEEAFKKTGKGLNRNACGRDLTQLKRKEGYEWLKEMDSQALAVAIDNLEIAYKNYYKKIAKQPVFKSKKRSVLSYTTRLGYGMQKPENNIKGNKFKLPKIGWVRFKNSKPIEGRMLRVTIKLKPSGKFYMYIMFQTEPEQMPKTGEVTGVDVGLRYLATLSDGTTYDRIRVPKELRDKIKKEERILARRQVAAQKRKVNLLDAKNYQKQRIKVARLKEKALNKKMDYLHKVSTEIVKNHDVIGIETLEIKKMKDGNKPLRLPIIESGWYELLRMIEYKAEWYGKKAIKIDIGFPSSQICFDCGHQHQDVKTHKLTEWTCPKCGIHHDRDLNASKNIKAEALRIFMFQPSE